MADGTVGGNATIGGINFSFSHTPAETGREGDQPTLAAGVAGTLSTRTNNSNGVATVDTGHGITNSNTLGVFWSGGSRRGATVSGVTANTVTFGGGAGDNLPVANTSLVLGPETTLTIGFAGDDATLICVTALRRANVEFQQSGGTSILPLELNALAGELNDFFEWHKLQAGGITNPLAGQTVGKVVVSNGDGSNSNPVKVAVVKEST